MVYNELANIQLYAGAAISQPPSWNTKNPPHIHGRIKGITDMQEHLMPSVSYPLACHTCGGFSVFGWAASLHACKGHTLLHLILHYPILNIMLMSTLNFCGIGVVIIFWNSYTQQIIMILFFWIHLTLQSLNIQKLVTILASIVGEGMKGSRELRGKI